MSVLLHHFSEGQLMSSL